MTKCVPSTSPLQGKKENTTKTTAFIYIYFKSSWEKCPEYKISPQGIDIWQIKKKLSKCKDLGSDAKEASACVAHSCLPSSTAFEEPNAGLRSYSTSPEQREQQPGGS